MKKVYLTTAIPYVNGAPHIGHALDYCQADVYSRYRKMLGDEVRFQAGTDEHGTKNYQKARDLGLTPEEYVAEGAAKFQDFIKKLDVENTDFIRTTDKDHERRCQEIWTRLKDHIYSARYAGWYCTGCERFVTEKEYAENQGVCPDHQKPYEKLEEENYYLRISDFKEKIEAAIESGELLILPEFRKKEVLRLLEDTPDVSISRPKATLPWGVPVPDDETQVMYVWIDALSNYITVLGYPDKDISEWWPATAQFVGKDILRFHAIIWPAMLLGLGLPLPKTLVSHGFVLANGQKMSKSVGNVVDPVEVIDKHGVDAFRYYFLRHIDTFADSDFTWEKFEKAYSGELANDLGNLVQRLATLAAKNGVGSGRSRVVAEAVPGKNATETGLSASQEKTSEATVNNDITVADVACEKNEVGVACLDAEYGDLMENFEFSKALDFVWGKIQALNRRIDEEKPWALAKNGEKEKLEACLISLISELLAVAKMLTPFLPSTAAKIADIFEGDEIVPPPVPLFPKE